MSNHNMDFDYDCTSSSSSSNQLYSYSYNGIPTVAVTDSTTNIIVNNNDIDDDIYEYKYKYFQKLLNDNFNDIKLLEPICLHPYTIIKDMRHARRLYVGLQQLPIRYINKDFLLLYFNCIINIGLYEKDMNKNHIISIYINDIKLFAFIEFSSIELTTAVLRLDGIMLKNVPLKLLRANEYKPELVKNIELYPIVLDIPNRFFLPEAATDEVEATVEARVVELMATTSASPSLSSSVVVTAVSTSSRVAVTPAVTKEGTIAKPPLASAVPTRHTSIDSCFKQLCDASIEKHNFGKLKKKNTIAIIGYYARVTTATVASSSSSSSISSSSGSTTPAIAALRMYLNKVGFDSLRNPEYPYDLDAVDVFDLGDIVYSVDDVISTQQRLQEIVSDLIRQNVIPFVVGDRSDTFYRSTCGLMSVVGGNVAAMDVTSCIDCTSTFNDNANTHNSSRDSVSTVVIKGSNITSLPSISSTNLFLSDTTFNPPRGAVNSMPSTKNRLVIFGAQGFLNTTEQVKKLTDCDGLVKWLNKDIHVSHSSSNCKADNTTTIFTQSLSTLGHNSVSNDIRPVSFNCNTSAISSIYCHSSENDSVNGFNFDETLGIFKAAGSDSNVVLSCITHTSEDENSRNGSLFAHMLYSFLLGVASRNAGSV